MPAKVKIAFASAEYQCQFLRPHIRLIGPERASTVQRIVDAMLPFGFSLKNVEVVAPNVPAEQRMIFRIPERSIAFQFGAESCAFNKDGASWSTIQDDVRVIEAVEQAFLTEERIEVKNRTLALAMHLQLLDVPVAEVLAPFLPEKLRAAGNAQKVVSHSVQVKWMRGSLVIDYSAGVANGIFVRMGDEYPPEATMEHMLQNLRSMEEFTGQMLDVVEATDA